MPGSILGNAVRRVEDPELLVGRATYVDNLPIDGVLSLALVRSPHAHARIGSIDTAEAASMPGVVAVFTAGDLNLPAHHSFAALNEACARPPLAVGKARFVGDPVAVVVAESAAAAEDAAEMVVVDYEVLPAVVDPEEALADGAPVLFDDLGTNLVAGFRAPEGPDPLEGAEVVVQGRFENQRVAVVPMEGNAIAVVPGSAGDPYELTIYVATQMPHMFRSRIRDVFGLDAAAVRVVTPDVGGAFGAKAGLIAEHSVAVGVARALRRPVKWVETRSENLVAMPHGRGQIQYVQMGLRRDGTIVGLRCRVVGDGGAYGGFGGGLPMGPTRMMAQGVYRIPRIAYEVAVAVTNTTPMGAFRGAGRPEAAAFLERILDMAADELGIDAVEIRRRNFIQPDEFPYRTVMGTTYDSGEYALALDEAVRLSGYEALRAEQERRRRAGDRVQLGVGVSAYVEVTAGGGSNEFGALTVQPDGSATIRVGTSSHGQGHATSFSMIVADLLGIPLDRIRFVQSDTDVVPRGGGTGGSRSLQVGGNAVRKAAGEVLERARALAAELLEADASDIVVTDEGRVGVAGVPATALEWGQLASAAGGRGEALEAEVDFQQAGATFPFGAHVSVVEVDADTGKATPVRHVAVDDCGRIVNPMIVAGQQHGGIAQGVAQALWEKVVFDADGNPLTTNLADYPMPSAAEYCGFETANTETPTPLNPLGAKGIGESATIGSTPAVQNAVVDALSHLGVRHVDMPCTPERVWRAIGDAADGRDGAPWREPPAVFATLPMPRSSRRPAAADVDI